jgi:hypothetical protein
MEPCYTKQYLDGIAKQKAFFNTHKKCSPMLYVRQNEECPKKPKKKVKK